MVQNSGKHRNKGNIDRNEIKLNIKLEHEYITLSLLIFKILNMLIYAYFVMLLLKQLMTGLLTPQ